MSPHVSSDPSSAFASKRVEITLPNGATTRGQLKRVSRTGLLVRSGRTFQVGDEQALSIVFPLTPHRFVPLRVKGRVVSSREEETAIEFVDVDSDSWDYLDRLAEYSEQYLTG